MPRSKSHDRILQRKFSERYARWYDLDGQSDIVCTIIADIHHQGRGTKTAVKAALQAPDSERALLEIGKAQYPERLATVAARIAKWRDEGKMGNPKVRSRLERIRARVIDFGFAWLVR